MPIVSFVTPKGGAGKTTATVVLACELAERGMQVAILDFDRNQPIHAWASKPIGPPKGITVYPNVNKTNIYDKLDEAEMNDWVFIDGEGSGSEEASYAICASKFVIIPLQKTQLDAMQASKAIKVIRQEERRIKAEIPFRLLFGRTQSWVMAGVQRDIEAAFAASPSDASQTGVQALPVELSERSAFQAIFAYGGSLSTLPAKGTGNLATARKNAAALADAFLAFDQSIKTEEAA